MFDKYKTNIKASFYLFDLYLMNKLISWKIKQSEIYAHQEEH